MSVTRNLTSDGSHLTIAVSGRFDFHVYDAFRNAYLDLDRPARKYSIDLSTAEYMDSAALGMLLLLREHAGGDSADIQILNPQTEVENVLTIAHFDKLFNIS